MSATECYRMVLYRHECFTEKKATCKIHTKLHLGPEWGIFNILTNEDIDDVISYFSWFFVQTVSKKIAIDLAI